MNVWTDGETMVVLGAKGLSVHRPDGACRLLGEAQLGMAPLSPSKNAWRWARRRMLAVTPGARSALFLNGDAEPVLAGLDGSAPEVLPLRIVEAIALDDERFAAVHIARVKGRDVARVGIGALPVEKRAKWAVDLDPARPTRVTWPSVIWTDGATPSWSRARCSTDPANLRLDANRYGIALADSASGTIAVVRPGGRSFETVLRIPTVTDARCWASCTERGLVVGLSIEGRGDAIVRFDKQGRAVVWASRQGMGPGHVTDAGELVYAMVGQRELRFADAESLEDRTAHPFGGEDATGDASLSVANGGGAVALGLGHHVMKWASSPASADPERVEQPNDPPTSEPPLEGAAAISDRPAPTIERVRGPAQLSLDPTRKTPEWAFERDAGFEIRVPIINIGGAAEGLYVEVGGDAVDQGLIVPRSVEVAGGEVVEAEFDGSRKIARLLDFEVRAGAVLPDVKKARERFEAAPEDMFLTVAIRGAVRGSGSGLLTVRVGFEGEGTRGSLMRGRSITVA